MRKLVSAVLSAVIVATSMPLLVTSADAQNRYSRGDRERYVTRYCDRNPRDRDCRDFRRNRHRWDDARYRRWYRDRYDDGDAAAAAIFGFAAGVIGGAVGAATDTAHRARCEAEYRSYDWRSDTYVGYDGVRRRCRL